MRRLTHDSFLFLVFGVFSGQLMVRGATFQVRFRCFECYQLNFKFFELNSRMQVPFD